MCNISGTHVEGLSRIAAIDLANIPVEDLNETVRHDPVRRAELVSLVLNRFCRVMLRK